MMGVIINSIFSCILHLHPVVGNNTYSIYTKMGVTLPVLKNEIKDFFFARLGTGGNYDPTLLFWRIIQRIKIKIQFHISRKYFHVQINYCKCYVGVCDYVVCSVACSVDVYGSFLLFVEMSPDVYAEDLPSCF